MCSALRFLLIFAAAALLPNAAISQQVDAFAVVDDYTGYLLNAKNKNKKVQIASLTKIATAMVVLDWSKSSGQDLSQLAIVTPAALQQGGINPVGLRPGDKLTLRDLLYAALLQSDNIAAYTLAEHVGRALLPGASPKMRDLSPSEYFVAQMNALARRLKMERTLFLNPHGLDHGGKPPHSTAADVARLCRYAMADPAFRFYVSQKEREITIHGGMEKRRFLLRNTNELLGKNGIDGIKTGRTRLAGDCLAVSAARKPLTRQEGNTVFITPQRLTVVVLGARDRFAAAASLLERGWRQYEQWHAAGRPMEAERVIK